jgi:hypothetical protein
MVAGSLEILFIAALLPIVVAGRLRLLNQTLSIDSGLYLQRKIRHRGICRQAFRRASNKAAESWNLAFCHGFIQVHYPFRSDRNDEFQAQ